MYKYIIDKSFDGYSVKEFLAFFKLSNKKINWIVNEKKYLVNGLTLKTLKTNDVLLIPKEVFNEKTIEPIYKNIDVLYEDDYLLIVDKPRGIIIHSDTNLQTALDNIVAGYLLKKGYDPIARHTYRLDKDTTGCMVYAKDPLTLAYLSNAVESKEMFKIYRTIVNGTLDEKEGILDFPIGSDRHVNGKMVVSKKGKAAITNYKVIKETDNKSLLEVFLKTGRTHQIRLHMSHIGHPVIGDSLYGKKQNVDLCLQATSVSFLNPYNKKRLTVEVSHKLSL